MKSLQSRKIKTTDPVCTHWDFCKRNTSIWFFTIDAVGLQILEQYPSILLSKRCIDSELLKELRDV